MSLLVHNFLSLKEEKDFIKKEVSFLDKLLPFLKKNLKLKVFIFIFLIFFIYKFHKFFVIIISIIFLQYIKFKRTKRGINLEIEPSYLFALAITLAYGLEYGLIFIIIPLLISFTFSIGIIINFLNKFVFILSVYLYWLFTRNNFFLIYFAILIVIITDIFGFFIRKKLGQNFLEIVQSVFFNSLIRWVYFSFFLDWFILVIK